jgi:hypothetical protein
MTVLVILAAVGGAVAASIPASANASLIRVSRDIYTDAQAQHRTEVEPDTVAFGSTIVSAFRIGRVAGGGCLEHRLGHPGPQRRDLVARLPARHHRQRRRRPRRPRRSPSA